MSLLQSILDWSQSQKLFLRDALRRLLDSPSLSETDYDDLFAFVKLEGGIPDANNRTPVPLELSHLPSVSIPGNNIQLLAVKSLKNVNRIAADQKVEFHPAGLTVIYGDNGTGKSGYSRVLKLACRARGEKADVLPNAHLPKDQQGTPEAEIHFDVNGTKTKFKWNANLREHHELASLSVFDAHCARAYLDVEQDVAYLPYGLDLVESLANVVLPQLNKRLKDAIADYDVDATQFADLRGTTKVGTMIAGLSAQTDPTLVEELATFTQDDVQRLEVLWNILNEQNPKQRADDLRRLVLRTKKLQTTIEMALGFVNTPAFKAIQDIATATDTAIASEELAVQLFHSGDNLLPSTGCQEWQTLFEAARKYAALAYEDQPFPLDDQSARCPLCQQNLSADGIERLQRFDRFIQDNAATLAQAKRTELQTAVDKLTNANLSFCMDDSLVQEIETHNPALCPALQALEKTIGERRTWMLDAIPKRLWAGGPTVTNDPRADLKAFLALLEEQIKVLDASANEAKRKEFAREFAELGAREKCSKSKQAILDAIANYKSAASLRTCLDFVKTTHISNKSKELAQEAVTQALSDALNREFETLNLSRIRTRLKSRAKDGKTYHKIILDVPTACKLTDVLSEGELRVVALGSFLAELSLANHSGGAIFDDPVSSLDHFRRAMVARRLADESKKRQVIIFTHDTVFLAELRGIDEREKLGSKFYHLEWATAEYSGYCNNGLPWHHQSFLDRMDSLEKECRDLKKNWTEPPNSALCDKMRTAYSHFRATIERAVESVFLCGVVRRFDNYVRVKSLVKVKAPTPTEVTHIERLYDNASNITNAHDPATGGNIPPPNPTQFEKDINELKTLVEAFEARK